MSPLTPGSVGRFTFTVDSVTIHFASLTVLIGIGVFVFALRGMSGPSGGGTARAAGGGRGGTRGRFLLTALPTLGAVLGVVFAGDLLTLFVFFEILALLGFFLVRQGDGARGAAIRYFWTMLVGGLVLLAGILLRGGGASGPGSVLLLLGFGVKAGMLPVHGWLPAAHSKAPAPASALLSGVMIKTGIYGIFRVLTDPATPEMLHATVFTLGLAGAAYGALRALVQSDAKRLLAWSSVSQVGVILTGIGAGAWEGSLQHVMTHASAKAVLFLAVGAVALRHGTVQLAGLGGLWRTMPVTFALSLFAGLALMGFPLLRASAGKAEIHHALEGVPSAEAVFFLASAGTVAILLKLIAEVFLGPARDPDPATRASEIGGALTALGLIIAALPLLHPALPTDMPYFVATFGAGTVLYLTWRRWGPAWPPVRIPSLPSGWTVPLPAPPGLPALPEARLQRAVERYAREIAPNLALLFVVLLAVVFVLR